MLSRALSARRAVQRRAGVLTPRVRASSVTAYERKTPVEHVLLRPGMYIGQVEIADISTWLVSASSDGGASMVKESIRYSPALLKIIDEILINAADNRHRGADFSYLHITAIYESKKLKISIKNDGASIPIDMHATENIHIPELIFGHLLTGSNFDDEKGSVVGGRHGYGAKLTNIFSNSFEVQIYNASTGSLYTQSWSSNMSSVSPPVITTTKASKKRKGYTLVTFEPDLSRFNVTSDDLVQNIVRLVERRAFDLAACAGRGVQVKFNDKIVAVSTFAEYVKLFAQDSASPSGKVHVSAVNERWEVGLMRASSADQMSFVNAIWTSRGGSHVDFILQQVVRLIEEAVQESIVKLNKKTEKLDATKVSPLMLSRAIQSRLFLFINCLVENPSFDSQGKEYLTAKSSTFGNVDIKPAFMKAFITASGITEDIVEELLEREQKLLIRAVKTKGSSKLLLDKLEDAHDAGSSSCSLILTEGDSAKALAVAGLEVIGRDKYGVFPLRGKILNVRDATIRQILKSKEVMNIIRAVGLDFTKTYSDGIDDKQGLRYGRVVLMTDQDADGSHIKGLVINLFERFWPILLQNGFLHYIATPLVKVREISQSKGKNSKKSIISFYSLQEYDAWRRGAQSIDISKYSVKYYKGLGTSTSEEAKEYFSHKTKTFKAFYANSTDTTTRAIDLAFSKKRVRDRRKWLESVYDPKVYLDPAQPTTSYEDFINKELIHFSFADNARSIPSAIDGLKPSQRKVLYACFKRKLDSEIKVVQLAGYIAEQTAYHHGEVSLTQTIVGMAQDFIGSNNVPLLQPLGQFGTRSAGGDDSASPRYIFTRLHPLARLIFPPADDDLLNYIEEDGQMIEPEYYIPIIPMLLVNGSQGIGTGWSSTIPPYNIRHIIRHMKEFIEHKSSTKLIPFVRGFTGSITVEDGDVFSTGVIKRVLKTSVEISELPYGTWTNKYKSRLVKMKEAKLINDIKEAHTTDTVRFIVGATTAQLDELEAAGLVNSFKLRTAIRLTNMHAFNTDGKISKYDSPEDICAEHFFVRYNAYIRRKDSLERKYAFDEALASSRSRFIGCVLDGGLRLMKSTGGAISFTDMQANLIALKFMPYEDLVSTHLGSNALSTDDDKKQFSYLLSLPIQSLTEERMLYLQEKAQQASAKLEKLRKQTIEMMWLEDLDSLLNEVIKLNY